VFLSALRAAARQGLQGTRDTTPGLCKVVDCLPALHVAVALRWLASRHSPMRRDHWPRVQGVRCFTHVQG